MEGIVLETRDLHLYYGRRRALEGINIGVPRQRVTALIGPSGCGKSTLLRCFNRLTDLFDDVRVEGRVLLHGMDIHDGRLKPTDLRRRVGMVFQKPHPFPKSVYENVAYGLRVQRVRDRRLIAERVEWALRGAALWDEVKDRLHDSALGLSGGQQQRLIVARAIAVEPEVILLDEPASSLDPISVEKLEELIRALRERFTVVVVTHSLKQASRISDYTGFLYMGRLVEFGATGELFKSPQEQLTADYVRGRFG
jgi:phosphate transport system ATP-binding protein